MRAAAATWVVGEGGVMGRVRELQKDDIKGVTRFPIGAHRYCRRPHGLLTVFVARDLNGGCLGSSPAGNI